MPTKPQTTRSAPQLPQIILTDTAVEDLAERVKEMAVEQAAKTIADRILDKVNKDALVRRMRQESVARARQALAKKGPAPAPATGPIQTEMKKIEAKGPTRRRGAAKPAAAAASAPAASATPAAT